MATVLKAISDHLQVPKSLVSHVRLGETLRTPHWMGITVLGKGWCLRRMGLTLPGSLGWPHLSLTCFRNPQSPPSNLSAEGQSVLIVHTFGPHSVPLEF